MYVHGRLYCKGPNPAHKNHKVTNMFRATAALFSKVITIPQLSPTHSRSRIVQWLATEGQYVQPYDLVLKVECSSDMVTEAYRDTLEEQKIMVIDTQEEGILRNLVPPSQAWLPVGTRIGVIEDDDDDDDDDMELDDVWTWQAYLD